MRTSTPSRPDHRTTSTRPFTLVGALATDSMRVVGAEYGCYVPGQVGYLAVYSDGSLGLEVDTIDSGISTPPWCVRADGTVLIPLCQTLAELDLQAVRRALRPEHRLGAWLTLFLGHGQSSADADGVAQRARASAFAVASANLATHLVDPLSEEFFARF